MRKIIVYLIIMLFAFAGTQVMGQSASATYTLGDILGDDYYNDHEGQDSSNCPGLLTVTIPVGAFISSVDVSYDLTTTVANIGGAMQYSKLVCISEGGSGEASNNADESYAPVDSPYTHVYSRTGLTIANGVVGGGDIEFELHVGQYDDHSAGCSTKTVADSNTWTVTVYYTVPGAANDFAVLNNGQDNRTMTDTIVAAGETANFHAVVTNKGSNTQTSDIIWECTGGTPSSDTATTISLAQEDTTLHVFSTAWTAPSTAGTYTATIYTDLTDDEERTNDTVTAEITVVEYLAVPLTEDFETGKDFEAFDNAPGNDTDWTLSTTYYHSGTQCAINSNSTFDENILVETGVMDLTAGTDPELNFWHIAHNYNIDFCYVEVSTNGGFTYTPLSAASYMGNSINYNADGYFNVKSYSTWKDSETPNNSTWWRKETFSLNDYVSTHTRLRFRFKGNNTSANTEGWMIDDITVDFRLPYEFTLIEPTGQEVQENTSYDYPVTINNNGINDDTYSLSLGAGQSWTYTIYEKTGTTEITQIGPITAQTSDNFIVRVTLPDGLAMGVKDTVNLTVTSQGNGSITDNFDIVTTAFITRTAPYTECFEDQWPPLGWSLANDGWFNWDRSNETTPYCENYFARANINAASHDNSEAYLNSIILEPDAVNHYISFYRNYYDVNPGIGADAELYIDIYDVDADTGWVMGTTDIITGTQNDGWTYHPVDLTNFESNDFSTKSIKVRFRAISHWGGFNIGIDKFRLPATNDVAVTEIVPQGSVTGTNVKPQVKISNPGVADQTSFSINLSDGEGYSSTYNFSGTLAAQEDTIIMMNDEWTPTTGTKTFTAIITLTGDGDTSNDTLEQQIIVQPNVFENAKLIGFNYYDGSSSGLEDHIVDIDLVDGTMSDLAASTSQNKFTTGDYFGDAVYTIEETTNMIYLVNANGESYKYLYMQGLDTITGITNSPNHGAFISNYDGTNTQLYEFDSNYDITLIGTIATSVKIVGIASNSKYELYGIGTDDNLYSIDTANGSGTIVGALGIDIDGHQDIGFEKGNDILYGTLYTTEGALYSIDTATGAASLIGTYTDRITSCAITPSETLTASGDGEWTAVLGATTPLTNVVIQAGNTITIPAGKATEECNTLIVEAGAALTIEGSLNVNNTLTIESDATGTGSLKNTGTLTVENGTTVQQYVAVNTQTYNWHYLTVPFAETADVFPGVDPGSGTVYASVWDEAADNYTSITTPATALTTSTGYAVPFPASPTTLTFEGSDLISGTQTVNSLGYSIGNTKAGFHLIGNSFTAALDVENAGFSASNWTEDIWFRTDGQFASYNVNTNIGLNGGSQFIPGLQAFWIRNDGVSDTDISMAPSALTHQTQTIYKSMENNILRLEVAKDGYTDEMVFGFFEGASDDFDNFDTEKMFGNNPLYPEIYSIAGSEPVAVNAYAPAHKDEYEIALGFETEENGTFTISTTNIADFDSQFKVYLKDELTGEIVNLREYNNYEFTSDEINTISRFKLVITKSTLDIPERSGETQIYAIGNSIIINAPSDIHGTIQVIDVSGKTMMNRVANLSEGFNQVSFAQPAGVYLVTIRTNKTIFTQKIVIR